MGPSDLELFLTAALRVAAPLLLAALGELVTERAGVINIGIEGIMLTAAFGATVGAHYSHSPWVGVVAGAASGLGVALLFALLVIPLRSNQVVVGAGINLFALGLTGTLYRGIFGVTGAVLTVPLLPGLTLPALGALPVVGPVIAGQNALALLGLLLVPALWWVLYRSYAGLALRALGETPEAVDTAGISVERWRVAATAAGGLLAGLGGAYLSVGDTGTFIEGMSAGRGFIALAIVIFGRWHPVGILGAALLFGAAGALQYRAQAVGFLLPWTGRPVPYQFLLMLPHVVTLLVLAGLAGRARPPAALGAPYERE